MTLRDSIFLGTFPPLAPADHPLLDKWAGIRGVRELANRQIESLRVANMVGSSLQAAIHIEVPESTEGGLLEALQSLGQDLKFVFITSQATVSAGTELKAVPVPVAAPKCERCWHYREDVGHDPAHPTLCARCTSNLYGAGEARKFA